MLEVDLLALILNRLEILVLLSVFLIGLAVFRMFQKR